MKNWIDIAITQKWALEKPISFSHDYSHFFLQVKWQYFDVYTRVERSRDLLKAQKVFAQEHFAYQAHASAEKGHFSID